MTTAEPPFVALLVIRHGEQERTGQDGPLTARGMAQVQALAGAVALAPGDLVVSSSRLRARQTAEALGAAPEVLDDLDEYRFGPTWDWHLAAQREDLALWRPEHHAGDETMREFQTRIDGVMEGLVRRTVSRRLIVCVHSGVIDAILRWAFGLAPDTPWTTEAAVPHASITELVHWPSGRHARGAPRHTLLVRVGDTRHLAPGLMSE